MRRRRRLSSRRRWRGLRLEVATPVPGRGAEVGGRPVRGLFTGRCQCCSGGQNDVGLHPDPGCVRAPGRCGFAFVFPLRAIPGEAARRGVGRREGGVLPQPAHFTAPDTELCLHAQLGAAPAASRSCRAATPEQRQQSGAAVVVGWR